MKNKEKKNNKRVKYAITFTALSLIIVSALLIIIPIANLNKGIRLISNGEYETAQNTLSGNFLTAAKKQRLLAEAGIYFEENEPIKGIKKVLEVGGTVNIDYDLNGGTAKKDHETLTKGKNISVHPKLDGYTFKNWDVIEYSFSSKNYNVNLLLKSFWAANSYDINISNNDGTGENKTVTVIYNEPYNIEPTHYSGYHFNGWYNSTNNLLIPKSGVWTYTNINQLYASWDIGYVTFGSYPQGEVTEANTINALNLKLENKLPSADNLNGWTSYKYIVNCCTSDFYWYKDVELNDNKYRAVYYSEHRPRSLYYSFSEDYTYYGTRYRKYYNKNTVYWFKFEPIKWMILEEYDNSTLLYAKNALYSSSFSNFFTNINDGELSNYETSYIRSTLINSFYDIAFSSLEKEIMCKREIAFSSSTLNDKVFLLSIDEYFEHKTLKQYNLCTASDYAVSEGIEQNKRQDIYNDDTLYSTVWTYTSKHTCWPSAVDLAHYDGKFHYDITACYSSIGVRPGILVNKIFDY